MTRLEPRLADAERSDPAVPAPVGADRHIVRLRGTSWIIRPRVAGTAAALLVVAIGLFLVGIAVNDYPLTVIDTGRILLGGGTRIENFVVLDTAVPRGLVAALVGFGLALSGAFTQTLTRNPLATPDILGVTAGAGAAAVLAIAFGTTWGTWFAQVGIPLAALGGGLATSGAMYLLAWPGRRAGSDRRGLDPFRLVLVGVGVTWLLQALTNFLLTRAEVTDAAQAQHWLVGSVTQAVWANVWPAAAAAAIGLVAAVTLARVFHVVMLGPDLARGLGVDTGRVSTAIFGTAVVVAALCVAAAGPIAFVALLAPQVTMRLTRSPAPGPVLSGLFGACLVLASDLLCRLLLPTGLPVGVVTAAVGGPFLVYLMIAMSRSGVRLRIRPRSRRSALP